ncbi:MAG: radical SAM/SPASM domain-containing protein [Rectinemataceae bacterium]|jgi:MoaA/NifB/PqqE/SkfB family radical SAM enzyme
MSNPTVLFSSQIVDVCKRALASRGGLGTLASLAFQRRQALRRAAAARAGATIPAILIASVTRRCNLDCAGCYAKRLRPSGAAAPAELSDDRFMELFEEAVALGVGVIMIAGGEPLLRRSLLERLAADGGHAMRGVVVPVFTNGTLLDDSMAELFGSTLVPIFSIEGDEAFTAERRGAGVHETALRRAAAMRKRGGLFGLSVTITSRNADSALSPDFLGRVADMGASVLFLVEYVPVAPGTEDLVLSDAQRAALNDESRTAGLSYPVIRLPGDEEAYGGCLAAGRGFIHVAPEGALEACPFAPFSDGDAGRSGLAAALDSPLMRAIRDHHHELTETRGGCALRDKAGWIASLGSCARAEAETGAA